MVGNITLNASPTRFLFIHYHIFKNGGSTIESILRREFGDGFLTLHGPADNSILTGEEVIGLLAGQPEIKALSSHHLRYPKPVLPGAVIFDCCFLRHPLDRLASIYTYFRGIDTPDPLCRRARCQSPGEFMRQTMQESPHLLSDVQVTLLANGGAFVRPAGNLWGADLYADIVRLNQFDLELYRRAQSEIRRRMFLVPGLDDRLADFSARCSKLKSASGASRSQTTPRTAVASAWGATRL